MITYKMRLNEVQPTFNFLPRGREIIYRLIMRAAYIDDINQLNVEKTNEENL